MVLSTRTFLSHSSAAILARLNRILVPESHSVLFSLSTNVLPNELTGLVTRLTSLGSSSAGCLSAPFPSSRDQNPKDTSLISCALAIVPNKDSVLFRSDLQGRRPTQVGRWHSFREKDEVRQQNLHGARELSEWMDWESVWASGAAVDSSHPTLPASLQAIKRERVHTVLYFTNKEPEGLNKALELLTGANKVGLVATSTPFVTGRPVTMFHNEKIYSDGAVGLVLLNGLSGSKSSIIETDFSALRELTGPLVTTGTEGNLVTSLDSRNPTKILLSAIREAGMNFQSASELKDSSEFYIGVLQGNKIQRVYHITAGDPKRGTISLECETAPRLGESVRFLHLLKGSTPPTAPSIANGFDFLAITEPDLSQPRADVRTDSVKVTERFSAASENGFLISRAGVKLPDGEESIQEPMWKCNAEGTFASVNFH